MRNALVHCHVDDPALVDTPQDWALAAALLMLVLILAIFAFGRD